MDRERYLYLLGVSFQELMSPAVSMEEFDFVLTHFEKDVESIDFSEND